MYDYYAPVSSPQPSPTLPNPRQTPEDAPPAEAKLDGEDEEAKLAEEDRHACAVKYAAGVTPEGHADGKLANKIRGVGGRTGDVCCVLCDEE
jgi:hypothetical protein